MKWFDESDFAASTTVGDYWIKTEPPRRELMFETSDGRTFSLTVTIEGDRQIAFHELRELT